MALKNPSICNLERISRGDTFQSAGAATRMICLPVYKESL